MPETPELSADFSYSPENQVDSEEVQFTDQSSGDISSRTWTFGDGSSSSAAINPTHIYSEPGEYSVVLKVREAGGANRQKTRKVNITAKYRAAAAWEIRGVRAQITITEYEAGDRPTRNRYRKPFDCVTKDYSEFAGRVKSEIDSAPEGPSTGPDQTVIDEIEAAVREALNA